MKRHSAIPPEEVRMSEALPMGQPVRRSRREGLREAERLVHEAGLLVRHSAPDVLCCPMPSGLMVGWHVGDLFAALKYVLMEEAKELDG